MKKLIFASHNSFTYLPVKWYMKPFNFMSRCQSKNIEEQFFKYNVRIFDLRVRFDKDGMPHVRHGLMDYGVVPDDMLSMLNDAALYYGCNIYVRVILETGKADEKQEFLFITYCAHLQGTYGHLKFTEGRRKFDWRQLFAFRDSTPDMDADFASVKGGKLNDLWPRLYSKRHNKKAVEKCDKQYLMLDFVDIR